MFPFNKQIKKLPIDKANSFSGKHAQFYNVKIYNR